mgnify:CR=1 FL=1
MTGTTAERDAEPYQDGTPSRYDSDDGLPPRTERVTTPRLIRAKIAERLALYEEAGILVDVEANLPLLTVVASPTTPGRVDCSIPAEVIPGLIVLGGDVRQLS